MRKTLLPERAKFCVTKAASGDLQGATKAWLQAVAKSNPELRLAGTQQAVKMSQRSALATPLVNPSPLGGQERIVVYTTLLGNGGLFYYMTLAHDNDAEQFQEAFKTIADSIKLTDGH